MTLRAGSLRHFGRIKNGTTPASGEDDYWGGEIKWATPEDLGSLSGDKISDTRRKVTDLAVTETSLSILPIGSILISTRAPVGHMAITESPMTFNQGCRGIIPNEGVYGQYLYYLLKSRVPELNALATGTTFVELSRDDLASVQVCVPPLETQHRIAQFLNKKTAQIDELIAKKRILLDRLAEQRQALITHAVTKGLNPNTPLKPSGIDWLGDIPAHWDVLPLKRVTRSATYGISASLEPSGSVAVLRMGNLLAGEIDFSDLKFVDEIEEGLVLSPGDVVFNRTNSLALVGKAALFRRTEEFPVSFASYLVRFQFNEKYDPEYANYVMGTEGLLALARTLALPSIGQANLNPSRYASIAFPIPPLSEQRCISEFLVDSVKKINDVKNLVVSSIEQMSSYRTTLVTAAVTGQIAGLQ